MKVAILAGGLGTRLSEETGLKPKPMVEIGGKPILWHIMKHYAGFGHREFAIALGYRGDQIKRYFLDYRNMNGSLTVSVGRGEARPHEKVEDDWTVHLLDTGDGTNTGGRVRRMKELLQDGTFMATYGDGVSDVDLEELLKFHKAQGRLATVTAVRPPARFGGLVFDGNLVKEFTEKPQIGEGWINGGFMVFEPGVFERLKGDDTSLEADVLEGLARDRQLAAFRHEGFWQCMDTLRDVRLLEGLWQENRPPWKTWK